MKILGERSGNIAIDFSRPPLGLYILDEGLFRVKWKESYATLGRYDVIDVVEASDPKEIEKVAMIIRAYGHSTTETMVGTPWKEFLAGL